MHMKPKQLITFISCFVIATLLSACSTPPPAKANTKIVKDLVEPLGVKIDRIATKHNVPPTLARALVEVESSFNDSALSKTNAVGLLQVLRSTARSECGVTKLKHLADEDTNLDCGFFYLSKLKKNHGSWYRALIAYNQGAKWVNKPDVETKKYAMAIIRKAKI